MEKKRSLSEFIKTLGPGLLYAGAAIGVSHLVQSTKAGAVFGFELIWVVLLANILKYPFFEFGPRYAAGTGESLIEGYRRLGYWAIGIFVLFTLGTMFTIQAAVTVVTAGLAQYLTGIEMDPWIWSAILLGICMVILGVGRYALLDRLMKLIIVILSVTTLVALIAAAMGTFAKDPEAMRHFEWGAREDMVLFLIPLVGWMPAPLDIAIWHSVWSLAKGKEVGRKLSVKESLLDFKVGFWGTAVLATLFVSLGALVMYGSGVEIEGSAGAFARQLIEMYAEPLGPWARPIIAVAAFTTMFSTTLTVFDAVPRVLRRTVAVLLSEDWRNEAGVQGAENKVAGAYSKASGQAGEKTSNHASPKTPEQASSKAPEQASPKTPEQGGKTYNEVFGPQQGKFRMKALLENQGIYWGGLLLVATGAVLLLALYLENMGKMVNLATTLSFLTAPVLALLNLLSVTGKHMPVEARPGLLLRVMSWVGVAGLTAFAIYYLAI